MYFTKLSSESLGQLPHDVKSMASCHIELGSNMNNEKVRAKNVKLGSHWVHRERAGIQHTSLEFRA